jgi:2-oxoglutarate ferredoxin oxidoreductase subunit gamma
MRREIMLAGSGGQGVITASIILAEAAALHEGMHVVQSQSYGPEARGGASSAHVIINDVEVGYPKVKQPQIMACLTQEALERFGNLMRPGGLLLTDSFFVRQLRQIDAQVFNLPMHETVTRELKLPLAFNICVLGALQALTDIVRPESLLEVVKRRVPARYRDQNVRACELGMELARNAVPWRHDAQGDLCHGASADHNGNGKAAPDARG